MATLQQIYVNLIAGCVIGTSSFGLFGLALRFGYNNQLAPRSWSRPKAILKNVIKPPYAFQWISWSMKLDYPDLMTGIPGTGTRSDGWVGPKLKVNLDGIIMLKYHVLLLKISVLASFLCLLVILPITTTADCDVELLGEGTCAQTNDLTDFEITTIAHIPPLRYNGTSSKGQEELSHLKKFWVGNISSRYVGIAVVALIIYWYTCHLVWKEWIENLALRRIFFLEHDHYTERLDELNEIAAIDVPEDPRQKKRHPWLPHPELRETIPNISLFSCLYKLPNQITTVDMPDSATDLQRQLVATVNFFDLCVPNQPGFSSSVAAVTILPEPAHVAQAWKKWYYCGKKLRQLRYIRSMIQLHLERSKAAEEVWVIDEEAPNKEVQSYMSGSNDLDEISDRGQDTVIDPTVPSQSVIEEETKDDETKSTTNEMPATIDQSISAFKVNVNDTDISNLSPLEQEQAGDVSTIMKEEQIEISQCGHDLEVNLKENDEGQLPHSTTEDVTPEYPSVESKEEMTGEAHGDTSECELNKTTPTRSVVLESEEPKLFKYANFDVDQFARGIGFHEEAELGNLVSGIDIEQLSVYAREFAQSSSNACPLGFGEKIVRYSSLQRLRRLEQDAIEALKEANAELVAARKHVNDRMSSFARNTSDKIHDKKDDGLIATVMEEGNAPETKGFPSVVRQRRQNTPNEKWQQAQTLAGNSNGHNQTAMRNSSNGGESVLSRFPNINSHRPGDDVNFSLKKVVSILEHPTYAVVTFTSRQAAVAARQCLADSSGMDPWIEIVELPVAPLADAVPWDISQCRGCCRPVSLTISEREKKCRRFLGIFMFLFFCFCYTIPLAATSQLLNPEKLAAAFPESEALQNPDSFFFQVLSGISSGFLYTVFFSFCPQLFKAIANFEGNVSSKRTAEDKALTYFWYFMMLTAFTGTALTQMLVEVFVNSASLASELKDVLIGVANSIPTLQAPVWMNWMIVRFCYTLPFLYMFQANTFGFSIVNWPWCNRLMRGGGPGGPPPYRIYVDSGTAFMCVAAISPVCPLIAPLSSIYYVVILVMLRWLLVFVYRPWYDTGGNKWPALHEIIVSSTIFGQVLLTTILALRNALFPASLILVSIIPTYLFSCSCKDTFLRSYNDAGLLQTSQLDGWDDGVRLSDSNREEYRRWLVDCHKASYVPICLAGSELVTTVEPAVVTAFRGDEVIQSMQTWMKLQRGARLKRFKIAKDHE